MVNEPLKTTSEPSTCQGLGDITELAQISLRDSYVSTYSAKPSDTTLPQKTWESEGQTGK